jgi:hypothetical protein
VRKTLPILPRKCLPQVIPNEHKESKEIGSDTVLRLFESDVKITAVNARERIYAQNN